tara:strand:+ start:10917 stop:11717 length:801 start_codon:yes stop_codon:yes gene_type:complete
VIHTDRIGTPGGVPSVLAHCFLGHSGAWAPMVNAMSPALDATVFDMPGHGRSRMPAHPGDFHALVSGLITDLVVGPSLLIGHSFGGASMLRHALHHPHTVTGLVLIEPVFFAAAQGTPEFAQNEIDEGAVHEALRRGDTELAARKFLALNEGSPDWARLPAQARALMARQITLITAMNAGILQDSGGLLAPGLMEGFDVPVLLILGGRTSAIFHATARALAARLPRSEIRVIDEAGHMAPISHPDQTARCIGHWIARTGQAAPSTV